MDWLMRNLRLWERGFRRLSRPTKKFLSSKFDLTPKQINGLRCRKRRGRFAGRNVIFIQISDLAEPEKILFEGYTESSFVTLKKVEN